MSSVFWSFEKREKIKEFYKRVTGGSMHVSLRIAARQFNCILEISLIYNILNFVKNYYKSLNKMHDVLSHDKVWNSN